MADLKYPSEHTPAEIMAALMIDADVVVDPEVSPQSDWPVYIEAEPDSEDTQKRLVAINTTNTSGEGSLQFSGRVVLSMGIQVITSAETDRLAFTRAVLIRQAANPLSQELVTLDSVQYRVHTVTLTSGPIKLGQTKAGRFRYSTNYLISVTVEPES